nr:hypothetical protein [Sedimentibacter sp.]
MRQISKYSFLFLLGGLLYYTIEMLYRGYSHPSMYILGGICFICIGGLNEFHNSKLSLISQMLISAFIITILELITGLIVNKWLKLNVWDYSNLDYNIVGQISLASSNAWFLLSLPAILLDDWLRYHFFNEEKPHYKIF